MTWGITRSIKGYGGRLTSLLSNSILIPQVGGPVITSASAASAGAGVASFIGAVTSSASAASAGTGTALALSGAEFDDVAELPISTPSFIIPTDFTSNGGTTETVTGTGGSSNLQTLINNAATANGNGNHKIIIPAGVSLTTGSGFTLPAKSINNPTGTGWIVIITSGAIPAQGTRVAPSDESLMPTITTTATNTPAILTGNAAHHYALVGLKVTNTADIYPLVSLGDLDISVLGNIPNWCVVDRCYLLGNTSNITRRAVGLYCNNGIVIDSYIAGFVAAGEDTQAIHMGNNDGPILIHNNRLQASGENVMTGGSDPNVTNVYTKDITITNNHIDKLDAWRQVYTCKNLLELKFGKRVLIQGNYFEKSWNNNSPAVMGQNGDAIVLNNFNQDGTAAWSTTQDITIRKNIIRKASRGINVSAIQEAGGWPDETGARYSINNNLIFDIGWYLQGTDPDPGDTMFQVLTGPTGRDPAEDVSFYNNTAIHSYDGPNQKILQFSPSPINQGSNFKFQNNVVTIATYGTFGDGAGQGTTALAAYWSPYTFSGNVLIDTESTGETYPGGNNTVASLAAAGVNATTYRITGTYEFKGADLDAVDTATFGVVTPGASSMP